MGFCNPIKAASCLLAVSVFLSIVLRYENADAQMRAGYPRMFNVWGVIDLSYINYDFNAESDGYKTESEFSLIQQRYSLGLSGYIYHPRLATFTSGITYVDTTTENTEKTKSKDIGYDLTVTLLPFRPISLDVYASKTDYTMEGSAAPMEASTKQYGAKLRIVNFWKLPATRLEYQHLEYNYLTTSKDGPGYESDRWDLSVQGRLRPIKTSYGFGFGFGDVSTSTRSYTTEYVYGNTNTPINIFKRNIATLSTYYRSSDEEFYKNLNYGAFLRFKPVRRFYHEYYYDYYENEYNIFDITTFTEQKTSTSTKHIKGTWGYGFTGRLSGSFTLDYNLNKEASEDPFWGETKEERWKSYGYVPRLTYRRPIAGLDLSSHYSLFYRKDEKRGNSTEHDFEIGIETRKLRWGTIYADYAFLKLDATDKFVGRGEDFFGEEEIKESTYGSMTHSFRTGMRGKGLGVLRKSNWNIEAAFLYGTSEGERPITSAEGDVVTMEWTRKTWEFTLFADLLYPLHLFGRDAMTSSKAGYSIGDTSWTRSAPLPDRPFDESDSRRIQRFYTHTRFNYPISRRLNFQLWRLQMWDKIEGILDRITTNYNILLLYRIGRVSLSLEYEGLKEEEGDRIRDSRRLFIRFRRPFG